MKNYKALLSKINTFVFDYDGVFTNGTVVLQKTGEPLRTANVKDGYAIQLANKLGYRIVIISGGKSESMSNRFDLLKVKDVFLGVPNKIKVYEKYLEDNDLKQENTIYMGDDIPDYKVMQKAGVACCPADAAEEIKSIAHYISHQKGGEGCVRDIIEQVLKGQGKWMTDEAFQW
ncbi:MAG: 3-deoxy-D-manno-octulosonate 8-phosphate phosphatase [Bacteroidetes bacterium]|nr:3-deoxy-D-manno-octulosonate 8-phosphate phosphatase [Bacteroidota bacterium]